MKQIIFLLSIITTSYFCQAQRLNVLYYGISSDSLHRGHQLEFTTDTTVEISTFPRHMSQQFKMTFNYKREKKTIKIFSDNISGSDSIALINHGFKQFLGNASINIDKKAIVDTSSKIVYVRDKDFSKKYNLTYIIDGKTYKQKTGQTNGYGILKKNYKTNQVINDKLASFKADPNNYTVNVYRGFDAYNKFGYNSVFGVVEIQRKN